MAYNTDIETGAVKDGTLYWTTKDVIPCGTCSTGTITTSYEKLVEAKNKAAKNFREVTGESWPL